MDHRDDTHAAPAPPDPERRATLAKLGLGAAAAWAAPSILSVPAASAATVLPECGECDQEFVINGGAETGVISPWIATAAGNGATFTTALWADIADQFIQPADSGLSTFYIETSSSTATAAQLEQRIELPGCAGVEFALAGNLGATSTTPAPLMQATSRLRVQFLDAMDTVIDGFGLSINNNAGNVPAIVNGVSSSPVVPAAAVAVRLILLFEMEIDPLTQGTAAGAIDRISFRLLCSPPA